VQPGVAVNDVVAAVDGVVAGAAQEDVATTERDWAGVEEAGQAGDQVDVVQRVLGRQQLDADDDVVERRAAGAFRVLPDVADRVLGAVPAR